MYIHNCLTYHKITKQHGTQDISQKSQFDPSQPIIHVSINCNFNSTQVDWDIVECSSFIDSPGQWIIYSSSLRI